jgi:site-specific DNA-methyltransferase (adenine-specific)
VWWHTIVPTSGHEKTGYPTQKPLGILRRIVRVHSAPNDVVLDFFAGSGTTGEAAALEGRRFVLVDDAIEAVRTCQKRLASHRPSCVGFAEC